MQNELLDDHQQTSLRFYYNLKATRNATLVALTLTGILLLARLILIFRLSGMIGRFGISYESYMWTANMIDKFDIMLKSPAME